MNIQEKAEELFYQALRIRLVEEKIIELYPSDAIQSPVHLSIGQEAVAVGICEAREPGDWLFINYRGHAFYLAAQAPLGSFFAELMGKRNGICGGKGGSMHLAAPEFGVMGSSAVVGSTISHAVGAALASKIKKENRIHIANFGDGATEQGVFHESLNFASLYGLPVLFLCENNGLAVHSPLSERQSFGLKPLVESYSISFTHIEDSRQPEHVWEIARQVMSSIRSQRAPHFLLVDTARYKEHVGPGEDFDAGYRSEEAINRWKDGDPLIQNQTLVKKYTPIIRSEIQEAVTFAENSPFPTIEDLTTHV